MLLLLVPVLVPGLVDGGTVSAATCLRPLTDYTLTTRSSAALDSTYSTTLLARAAYSLPLAPECLWESPRG
jgi:hypothetical protein